MDNHPSLETAVTWLDRRQFLSDTRRRWARSRSRICSVATDCSRRNRRVIDPARPFAPRQPHFPAKAKNVVVIFCAGAVSQLETWDYKPELIKHDGSRCQAVRR